MGNASNATMDKVRPKDITVVNLNLEDWVLAGTGGISTFDRKGAQTAAWWCLDMGYDYGNLLLVWNDSSHHWSWQPACHMLLSEYKLLLRATHMSFYRV